MPSLIIPTCKKDDHTLNEKGSVIKESPSHRKEQWSKSMTGKEQGTDWMNDSLMNMLLTLRQQQTDPAVKMDEQWLHLVSLSTEYVLLHLDDLPSVSAWCQSLWDLGKMLKRQDDVQTNVYSQAIRVMIYHCRASIHFSQKQWVQALTESRKCIAINLPRTPNSLLLQKVNMMQENAASMLEKSRQHHNRCHRLITATSHSMTASFSSSSIASMVSAASSSSSSSSCSSSSSYSKMKCSLCSLEKRVMPVCAQCKSQVYCGIKCLKEDKERHSVLCQSLSRRL